MNLAPKRRWLQFSMWMLFVVVTVICVWLGYHLNWIRERHNAIDEASFSWREGLPEFTPWRLRPFGESCIEEIRIDRGMPIDMRERELKRLASLFPEALVAEAEGREIWEYYATPRPRRAGNEEPKP